MTTVELGSVDSRAFWLDLADRTVKTFIQNVLLFLGAGVALTSVSWTTVLSSAGLAALVSFLIALANTSSITSGNFLIDTADRAARTFAGTLVAAIPATGGFADVNWWDATAIAGTAVVISVLTSLASTNLGASKGLPSTAPVAVEFEELEYNPTADEDAAESVGPFTETDPGETGPFGRHSER